MQKLHSEVDPAFFSNSFMPMKHLVKVLSAEARQRRGSVVQLDDAETIKKKTPYDASDSDEEEASAVRVLTIEGGALSIEGLTPASTVEELRRAVEGKTGISKVEMRLYIDTSHLEDLRNLSDLSTRLEPLNDGAATLGDLGVFTENVALHLRNREYESLRHQLQVSQTVLEDVLEDHYDAFQDNFERVRQMAKDFDTARAHVAHLKDRLRKTRAALGLPESRIFNDLPTTDDNNNKKSKKKIVDDDADDDSEQNEDDDDDDDDGNHLAFARRKTRLIDVFEKKAEQDEIIRLLSDLRRRSLLEQLHDDPSKSNPSSPRTPSS